MADKSLFITVGGTVTPLKDSLREGKTELAQFAREVSATVDASNAELRKLVADPNSMKQMEAGLKAQISGMQRAAKEAITAAQNAPGGMDVTGRMTAVGATAAAEALEKMVVAEQAALAATAATTGATAQQAAMLETNAVAMKANIASLTQNAAFYRDLAAVAPTATIAAEGLTPALARTAAASNSARIAQMELMGSVRGVTDAVAMGRNPIQAIGMEMGRLSEAAVIAGGSFGKLGAFLSSGWGIAATLALPTIFQIAEGLLKQKDAAKGATDALQTLQAAARGEAVADDALNDALKKLNDEQEKSLDLTNREIIARREAAHATLEQAQAARAKLDTDLAAAKAMAPSAFGEASGASMGIPGVAQTGEQLKDANVKRIQAAIDDLNTKIGNSMGLIDSSIVQEARARATHVGSTNFDFDQQQTALETRYHGTYDQTKHAYVGGVLNAPGMTDARRGQLAEELRQKEAALIVTREKAVAAAQKLDDAEKGKTPGNSLGDANALGNMTALLERMGMRITSTTGGKHVAGSDHYAGRAIDFVPAGGMGRYSYDEMLRMLGDAGVDIRRNEHGTLQFFGPGHGPNGPNDHSHDNHFHVAFNGAPSPEHADQLAAEAARKAQELADRQRHNAEALDQAMDQAMTERAQIARDGVTDARQLGELDKAAIDAALKKQIDDNQRNAIDHNWTGTELMLLDMADKQVADAKKAEVDRKTRQALTEQELKGQEDALQLQGKLIEIQGQLATTVKEKLRLALAANENDRQQALTHAATEQNAHPSDNYAATVARINATHDAQRGVIEQNNLDPMQAYAKRLHDATDDMDSALKNVEADGLQSLEAGLVGIIDGTESVASAFKKMALSIIADLARIAIEKAIIAFIPGLKDGGAVQHLAGGGMVFGAGGPRDDAVFAMLSAGEFVVNAAAYRRHPQLVQAINEDKLPRLADGGLVGAVAYPAMPSAASLRAGGGGGSPLYFDLRGAVVTEDLLRQMNAISARHAMAAIAAGPALAMQELGEQQSMQIPA